jgi:uncharacterized protein YcgI (DUF1989 family)
MGGTKMALGCTMSSARDATQYTNLLLNGMEYHHCCHSNLTRALAIKRDLPLEEAEAHVHDVMNVFMCTGYTRDTHQYFMKASPVRPGDFIEFFAEIDLLVALSACPATTAATVTPMTLLNAIRLRRRSTAARESVGGLAVAGAEQIFSLAWNPVRGDSDWSADR